MRAPPHRDEPARLAALRSYGILDTPQESDFDDLVRLAAQICEVPVALITLLDAERQWFKAKVGTEISETPTEISFCSHAILQDDVMVVSDMTHDPRFVENPLVTGGPEVRFYAGAPLVTPEGLPLGTLCVLDTEPRDFSEEKRTALRTLGRQAMAQLELRRQARQIDAERHDLETTLETAEVGTWRLDIARVRVAANPVLRDFFGIEAPEASLDDFKAAIPPEDWENVHRVLSHVQSFGGRYEVEHRTRVGGKERWLMVRGEAELDGEGGVVALSGVAMDITDRKRTQSALEAERQRFRDLLDEVPAHIVTMVGSDLRYGFANQAFQHFVGEDVTGKTLIEAWPEVPEPHLAMLRTILETGEPVAGREAPVVSPNDPEKLGYFDFVFQPLKEPDGSVSGIFVHSAEVTESVRARHELAEERAWQNRILASAEVATFDWDAVEDHVYANPLLQTFFGVSDADAAGGKIENYLAAVHEKDRAGVAETISASMGRGESYETEYRVTGADGKERWVLARGEVSLRDDGRPGRLAGIVVDITVRKEAEAEREQLLARVDAERRKLEAAFSETPTFICVLRGEDLVFDYVNPPYYTLIGHRPVLGRRLADALPEIQDQGYPELLLNVIRTGERWEADEATVMIQRVPDVPLEERILNLRYSPVREADGSISGVYSHAVDVTDQVVARRYLAESERRFRLGQQAGRVGTFEWLVPEDRVVWSPELESLYGVPEGTFEGKFSDWVTRVEPEDAARVLPHIEATLAREEREISYEFRAILPSGERRWFVGQAQFDYDEAGKPLRMAGVNVDIHDRKRAEAELRESEQRFRIVAQATRDAVWDWDLQSGSVWWNEGITELFGYSREEIVPTGDWWIEQIHLKDRDRIAHGIHGVIEREEARWHAEYRFRCADGTYLTVDDRGYAVSDEAGKTTRMVGAMADVTKDREEAARLVFMRDLTEATANLRDPRAIIEAAERLMGGFLRVSRTAYAEVEEDENTFTMWDWSPDLTSVAGTYPLESFGSRAVAAMRSGKTLVIGDVDAELLPEEGADTFNSIGIKAIVCCPLVKGGKLAAMMAVHQKEPRHWKGEEIALVEQVVDRMWAEIERARAETALRQNAEQLQTIFDNAEDDAIILMDAERRIVAWNRAAEKICGWTASEAIGQQSGLLFTRADREAEEPERKAAVAAKEGKIISERWYQRRDGTRFWGSGTMTALRNSDGSVRGFLKLFRDATTKRRELETLAFLQKLTDATRDLRDPQAILDRGLQLLGEHMAVDRCAYAEIEADVETAHILGNWRHRAMDLAGGTFAVSSWGSEVARVLQQGGIFVANDVSQALPPEDGGDALRANGIEAAICAPLIKDGRLAGAMAVHHSQVRLWTQDEVGLVGVVADRLWSAMERARTDQRIRTLNEELEERVTERTEQLQAAIQEAEAFNYSISHDLRAPLRSIVATSRILLEDLEATLNEEHLGQLRRQAHNATRLGVLIDELLRLSRLGRVEVQRGEIDITELVEELAAEMERANMTRGCRIEVQPSMRSTGDPRLVRLVYSNLLENACKFSPEGGAVRAGQEGDVLSVKDEGVGFDMVYAHKLFLPFERLVTEEQFPGTGIGLANVERIIRRHHGRVWAESEPGNGASFFFTLGEGVRL